VGIVHDEFNPEIKTVNKEVYIDILHRLRVVVRKKRPGKYRPNIWFLLHDNAPVHRSVSANDFLAKSNAKKLKHPPYSPNLASADIHLPRLKSALKGRHLCDAIAVIKKYDERSERLSSNDFQENFQVLYSRW